jgi:hypothetical protein
MHDISAEFIKRFVSSWLSAWNQHDPCVIKDFYAPNVEFYSPHIMMIYGMGTGKVVGRDELCDYYRAVMALMPQITFTLKAVFMGNRSMTIHYLINPGGAISDFMVFDEFGKIREIHTNFAI